MHTPRSPSRLGLIGGLGVGATITYYRSLVEAHARAGLRADIMLAHADLGVVLDMVADRDVDGLAAYLNALVERLGAAGADVVAISAVAPHLCAPQLARLSSLPLVSLVDALRARLTKAGLTRIALFGTRIVMDSDLFGRLQDFEVVRPRADEIDSIHRAYTRIAGTGRCSLDDLDLFRRIAERLCVAEHAQTIVLAGTDFSVALADGDPGFPYLDCTEVHVDEIVRFLTVAN
jgi:aspartate racemase